MRADHVVRTILEEVAQDGDAAVRRWTLRLDRVEVHDARVADGAMRLAWETTEPSVRNAIIVAAGRIRVIHEHQRDGAIRGTVSAHLRPLPLRRAGCYIPGGRAAYPSTVLMNVIPAQVAGVGEIAITSPPGPDGSVHPLVLACAHHLGVTEVHAIGGAQAIGALAYGTESIPRVDKITGPGNLFVTLAKRAVFGEVGIDGVRGPTEILVIASADADPRCIAADLVSQLEHDPLAWAVCLTNSPLLAHQVSAAFVQEASAATRGGIIASAAGRHGAVIVTESLDAACVLADEFAAEHLSLQGAAAEALRDRPHTARRHLRGAEVARLHGRLRRRPQPHPAHRRRRPLSRPALRRGLPALAVGGGSLRRGVRRPRTLACILARSEGLLGHERAIRLRMEAPLP